MSSTVPRAWIDGYADSLQNIDDHMRSVLKEALARVDYSAPVADVRNQLIEVMQPVCYQSRSSAAQLAAEFYDGMRRRMVGEGIDTVLMDGYEPVDVEQVVRASVSPLSELDGAATAEDQLLAEAYGRVESMLVDYFGRGIREAAGNTVFENGRRDPREVLFARIPRGSKSYPNGCPFCQMLASRGFAYLSKLTAGGVDPNHYHNGCQCMVVPSWGPGSVEGYNPRDYDAGYQAWLDMDHSQHEQNVRDRKKSIAVRRKSAGR